MTFQQEDNPIFYLAPIRGITNRIYRNCFTDLYGGMDGAITPFIQTVKGHLVKPTHLEECDPALNRMPILPQIIGRDPGQFLDLAHRSMTTGGSAPGSLGYTPGCWDAVF